MAHFITNGPAAGARGVEDLAVDPTASGGNHARKVRECLGLTLVDNDLTTLKQIPFWDPAVNKRVLRDFTMRLPQDCIAEEYRREPSIHYALSSHPEQWDVASFTTHPIVRALGTDKVAGLGMYSDKVPVRKSDSFLRVSVGCVWARSRQTSYVVRTSTLCRCGCNGDCTLLPIMIEFNRSINELQEHGIPDADPPLHCALCEYRGDWPERAHMAQIKNHSGNQPCGFCHCTKDDMHSKYSLAPNSRSAFPTRTHATYLAELQSRINHVHVHDEVTRAALADACTFRQARPFGRRIDTGKLQPILQPFGLSLIPIRICCGFRGWGCNCV
jgi:hypothetical protein